MLRAKIIRILEGMGSIVTLVPIIERKTFQLPTLSISQSLQSDWEKIGQDMWKAVNFVKDKNETRSTRRNEYDKQHASK